MSFFSSYLDELCYFLKMESNNVFKSRKWEWENKTWVPRVSVCLLHIPEDTLNRTLAAQQQPGALWWQQTQFSKQGASGVRAFWRDEVFSVCTHSGWWQRHFCRSPAELSLWPPSTRNDIKMMPGERFGRVMRIDVDFLSFLSSGILMLSRIWCLLRFSLGEEGSASDVLSKDWGLCDIPWKPHTVISFLCTL